MKFLLALLHPLTAITKRAVAEDARTDARKGIYQPDAVIESYIGPEPSAYEPEANSDHAEIERDRNSVTASELASDVDTAKRAATREFSPVTMAIVALLFFAFETAAAALLGHVGGLSLWPSVVFGAMFAAVLFKLTELCSRADTRSGRYWLAMAGMATLVAAVVLVRKDAVAADGETMPPLMRIAWTVIFTGMTVGPAWLASLVLKAFFAGHALRADLNMKKDLHKGEARKVDKARKSQRGIQAEHQMWTSTYRILRAVYDSEWHRLAPDSAAAGLPPVNPTTPLLTVSRKENVHEH